MVRMKRNAMLRKMTGPGLFRLFLAFLVFAHHTTRLGFGTSAVFIFFSLSGFWIYKMYMGRYSATRVPYLTYLVSRAWRLLPVFVLISVLTLAYLYWSGSLANYYRGNDAHFAFSSFFILGYYTLHPQPMVPAWSLDIEMQFYLIAPLIAILLARRIVAPVWAVVAAAFISAASVLLGSKIPLPSYLLFFVIGMTAASVDWRPSRRLVMGSVAALATIIVLCVISPWREILLIPPTPNPYSVYSLHANVVLAFLAIPYALYTTGQEGFCYDNTFGELSYIVYLLHWVGALYLASSPAIGLIQRYSLKAVVWCIVIGLSLVIWKFYDKPINRLRVRWVKSRSTLGVISQKSRQTVLVTKERFLDALYAQTRYPPALIIE